MQSKLGCKQNNDAACLNTFMSDPEQDGTYGFVTNKLPVGEYEAQVVVNGNKDDLYGDGGKGGKPVKLSVKQANQEVFFGFDAASGAVTVSTVGAPKGNIAKQKAHWIGKNTLMWGVIGDAKYSYELHYSPDAKLQLDATGIVGGAKIAVKYDEAGGGKAVEKFPHLAKLAAFKIDAPNVKALLKGQLALLARDDKGNVIDTTGVQIAGVLDDVYAGRAKQQTLGVSWQGNRPTLRVWAPTAKRAVLRLFDNATTDQFRAIPMRLDSSSGVWSANGPATWKEKFYLYEIEVFAPRTGKIEKNLVTDPYSLSLSVNSKRSQIVNLRDAKWMPKDFFKSGKPALVAPEDAVIYELHIRDFSIDDESAPQAVRGKFAGLAQIESNGGKHLQSLAAAGLTHVHLLPAFDIASINEDATRRNEIDPKALAKFPPDSDEQTKAIEAIRDADGFNWGYDPFHYTVPEGSYATDPNGAQRINEFRLMVQTLNGMGLRVVMDVVYNHTNASGQDEKSVLDKIVPNYYHRLNGEGAVERSTCCENTATEHAMMEKLMIDSVTTWAREYRIDGFRFDLMGHHLLSNMKNVRAALDSLTPAKDGVDGKSILLYGEGWNFGEVANNARGVNATQLNLAGSGIGSFSDRLRDGVRGGSPFSDPRVAGFASGLFFASNSAGNESVDSQKNKLLVLSDWIRLGLAGNLKDYEFETAFGKKKGEAIQYNGAPAGYALDPQETIHYASAHDNETIFDKIQWASAESATMTDRVRMNNLANAVVMFSQGIPFFHAGDDILRSKSLDRDSYNSSDWFNALDWTYETNGWGRGLPPSIKDRWAIAKPLLADAKRKPAKDDILFARDVFRELLQIRKSSKLFRLQTGDEIKKRVTFFNTGSGQVAGLIVMRIDGDGLSDPFKQMVVALNTSPNAQTVSDNSFKGAKFELHPVQAKSVDRALSEAKFDSTAGTFVAPGRSAVVWVVR
jgi:pullulanase-type alpha-1,6-glucosidase